MTVTVVTHNVHVALLILAHSSNCQINGAIYPNFHCGILFSLLANINIRYLSKVF